ncbi:AAA family ATPase [Dactylosporangium cerinum]|uniref:AAA family ATPase n=1 Tax=Dactylosporangium cerinum TaxID=1434730 RepID=A0ABV9WAG6_9ACTN
MSDWFIYTGQSAPHQRIDELPPPPNWRNFKGDDESPDGDTERRLGSAAFRLKPDEQTLQMVNAALYLRRPLLISGKPGAGKSSLAYAVAKELNLGPVLRWPITSRSTLRDGLYHYDPIARLGDENLRQLQRRSTDESGTGGDEGTVASVGQYIRLGPLGTALLPGARPRALLIDEIDKGDFDLPNDLLNIFEEGEYGIDELARLSSPAPVTVRTADRDATADISGGHVRCKAFPFVVLTSNDEREFPPAFLRRCLRLDLTDPKEEQVAAIVAAHLGPELAAEARSLIADFISRRSHTQLATDQLLNAVYIALSGSSRPPQQTLGGLIESILRGLSGVRND